MPTNAWTYISFPGSTRAAMTFYQQVFGGELTLHPYGEFPLEGMPFAPEPDSIAHSTLEAGQLRIAAGDDPGSQPGPLPAGPFSLLVSPGSLAEAKRLIDRFAANGGQVEMPFEVAPWGGWYGQVRDRYGVLWAFDAEEGAGG